MSDYFDIDLAFWLLLAALFILIIYKFRMRNLVFLNPAKRHAKKNAKVLNKHLKKSVKLHFSRELEEEIEEAKEQEKVTKMNQDLPALEPEIHESRIVKLLKPFGFFTRLIFAERADLIKAQMEMKDEKGGFWEKHVKAQKKASRGKIQRR